MWIPQWNWQKSWLEDEGFKIDHEGFQSAMKEQQDRACASG